MGRRNPRSPRTSSVPVLAACMRSSRKATLRSHAKAATAKVLSAHAPKRVSRRTDASATVPTTFAPTSSAVAPRVPPREKAKSGQSRNVLATPLPKGVQYVDANYSSGTDMEGEDDIDERVLSGFPPALRTLEKDTALLKKLYPSIATSVIQQTLIDTIPKRDDQHSYFASLVDASARLEALQNEALQSRRSTLRSVDT
ncbi:hypothetical protein SDRG_01598 [Saprolegnia diclina VS20]|uniref:Uncharacterized protein n=1 Tax=Saprolegnia diclina (strain VS20) TaxID=1156394 RepID=T0R5G9_SAPDV|nr:hypothetical protein SDRG_01598 [Saprolegnia diclina VS20]EQC41640.1 hypothetical protein SDRG_01598 [Saprolegnia diclina VS20]|eukprot:XP_008605354.1 hypothetical protein SDRG_01598 [Saprolegnia diclina VS20]